MVTPLLSIAKRERNRRVIMIGFVEGVNCLFKDIPVVILEGLLTISVLGGLLTMYFKGIRNGWRMCCVIMLLAYLFLLYSSTVIFRQYNANVGYNFYLFWSYSAVNKEALLRQNILNILVFLPIGLMHAIAFRRIKLWQVLLIGICISVSIESLQFFLKRGFAELDDVMHNMVGCMMGYGVYKFVKALYVVRGEKALASTTST